MVIIRKQKLTTPDFNLKDLNVGDQVEIELTEFGKHTATVQRIHNKKAYILFDDCVCMYPMNGESTNDGGFNESKLNKFMQEELLPAFPKELIKRIKTLTIPTFGQIFGHNTGTYVEDYIVVDKDTQFELMKNHKNRVADYKNGYSWYWLRNATKKSVYSSGFAYVDYGGYADCDGASCSIGVRPLLVIDIRA